MIERLAATLEGLASAAELLDHGGLAMHGGLIVGPLVGAWLAYRWRLPILRGLDVAAPSMVLIDEAYEGKKMSHLCPANFFLSASE